MSARYWTDCGYGICLNYNDIDTVKLRNYIEQHYNLYSDLMDTEQIFDIICDVADYGDSVCSLFESGLNAKVDGFPFLGLKDENGEDYLIYQPTYPWCEIYEVGKIHVKTKEQVEDLVYEALSPILKENTKLEFGYHEVLNYG